MQSRPDPVLDIALAAFLIAIAAAFLWETRNIPPGIFEPLGSAPVPQATATILILLCLAVLLRALMRLRRKDDPVSPSQTESKDDGIVAPENPRAVIVTGILTVAYVLALSARVADFALVTTVFLFALIAILARFERRALVLAAIIAVAMGYGCQYVFTEIFVVDLPSGQG